MSFLTTLKLTKIVLKNQIKIETGVKRTRVENLSKALEDVLNNVDRDHMPKLESEESAEQRKNRPGQGLKILTPNQMLSRLPISLVQLNARNNSEKIKNEIRQLLYSFRRSKKLIKQL